MADTAHQLLDAAQALVEERGFNAVSYKDLAAVVGIRTASIHYHFQAKADLGAALIHRYTAALEASLAMLDAQPTTERTRLKRFIALYRATETRGAICLCGSLASDQETLPDSMQTAVRGYLRLSEEWIARTIRSGVRAAEFAPRGRARDLAVTLLASLQGGLLLARSQGAPTVLDRVQRTFFDLLPTT